MQNNVNQPEIEKIINSPHNISCKVGRLVKDKRRVLIKKWITVKIKISNDSYYRSA
jgi:hypothetical protein